MAIEEKLSAIAERADNVEMSYAAQSYAAGQTLGASQADVAPLLSAVEAVLELHKPMSVQMITGDCATEDCDHDEPHQHQTETVEHCAECWRIAEEADYYFSEERAWIAAYPCDTRKATEEAMSDDDIDP